MMRVKLSKLNRLLLASLVVVSCSYCGAYNLDTQFPIIYKGSKGSYFGYTTALHRNRWGYLALIGAPKANTTTFPDPVYEPGTVYRCNITRKTSPDECQELHLMQEGAVEENRRYENAYRDRKQSMWLGVSLGVRPSRTDNDIVTCGHLWKNQYHHGYHLVNGVCYAINGNLEEDSIKKLLPLTKWDMQFGKGFDGLTEYSHALGQVGMSLAFSENGTKLLLGAPGVWSWTGSVVIYGTNRDDFYRNPSTPQPPYEAKYDSYIGYSVATGNFFESNTEYFAVSAPRDGYKGKVYIVMQIRNSLRVHDRKHGAQMGEYFGASVLGVNLNGDSFTDLLVGAPLHSYDSGGDEGKVYVFISNGKDLQKYTELTGDKKENSRFGTALAHIGDLDQDGFSDIAVGAPYEDEGGSVYIYHGTRTGIRSNYKQKIEASQLNSRLSGFGIHISPGMDIDNNGYPDILIGSYASSNAVLLRSRPIIMISPALKFNPKRIGINQTTCDVDGTNLTCVRIDVCLWYWGKHAPSSLDFRLTVSVNDPSRRAFFTAKRVRKTGLTMVLDYDKKTCTQFQLNLNEDIKDVITPIAVQFSHEMVLPKNYDKSFIETFPIYHPNTLRNVTSEIPFQTGCGKDDECHADLVVSATRIEPEEHKLIILGKFPIIAIVITVKNMREPAYLSELLIDLPPELSTIKYDYFCDVGNQQTNASLVCSLGNPLKNNTQVQVNIKLDATKIPPHTKYLEIVFRAKTLSTEINPEDNVEIIPLHLETKADIGITGFSSSNQIMYDGKRDASEVLSHTYTIRNHGPSPLENIDILLNIPYKFLTPNGKKQFISFTALKKGSGTPLSISSICDDACLNLKEIQPSHKSGATAAKDHRELIIGINDSSSNSIPFKSSIPSDLTEKLNKQQEVVEVERENSGNDSTSFKARGYLTINCMREDIECISLRCSAAAFADPRKFAQISLEFLFNFTVIDDYLGSWYGIEFSTDGSISINDAAVVEVHDHLNSYSIQTILLHEGPPPPEKLSAWIVFVSVGVGVVLLLIILIILIKIGFFRRKEKDMMKELLCDTKKGEENPQPPIDDITVAPE